MKWIYKIDENKKSGNSFLKHGKKFANADIEIHFISINNDNYKKCFVIYVTYFFLNSYKK